MDYLITNPKKWFQKVLLLFLIVIFISGCTANVGRTGNTGNTTGKKNEREVLQTIEGYNRELTKALKTHDLTKVKDYTTESRFSNDELYIAYLQEKKKVNEQDELLDSKVEKSVITEDKAEVSMIEVWRVKQQSIETKKITDFGEIYYRNTYHLVMQKSKWYIDSIESTELSAADKKARG